MGFRVRGIRSRIFLTNKDGHGGKGTLAAAIPGTKSDEIISILVSAMSRMTRRKVKEVTCDLSPSMMLIARDVFHNATVVNDRFHVQQVYNEAVEEIRMDIRRQLIAQENNRDKLPAIGARSGLPPVRLCPCRANKKISLKTYDFQRYSSFRGLCL